MADILDVLTKDRKLGDVVEVIFMKSSEEGPICALVERRPDVAFKLPKYLFSLPLQDRNDLVNQSGGLLANPGIYFLLAKRSDIPGKWGKLYVGQVSQRKDRPVPLFNRLSEHKKDNLQDFHDTVFFFTTQYQKLDADELNYLENAFYNLALKAGRYQLMNGSEPTSGKETLELKEMVTVGKRILYALGFKGLERKHAPQTEESHQEVSHVVPESDSDSIFHIKFVNGPVDATMKIEGDDYLLLAGSHINLGEENKRAAAVASGLLSRGDGDFYVVNENKTFSSSSPAAAFVLGYRVSGPAYWKNDSGETLGEIMKSKGEEIKEEKEVPETSELSDEDNPEIKFYITSKGSDSHGENSATMIKEGDSYVVQKGSNIIFYDQDKAYMANSSITRMRNHMKETGEIKEQPDGKYVLTKNVSFNSPSSAASFVLGTSANGRTRWLTPSGVTLQEVFSSSAD